MRGLVWLVGAALVGGCSGKDATGTGDSSPPAGGAGELGAVLTYDQWAYVAPADDPFFDHADGAEPCPSIGYEAENGFFELETDYCAIGTFSQATALELPAGSRIEFVVWNLDLWAPEPYEAVRALHIGDLEVWTDSVAVPGDEDVSELQFDVPVDVPAGTRAWFHLRNHGINSWRLGDVERVD